MWPDRHTLGLSWRLLRRDWRAGELRVLLSALLIAVASTTAITLFSDRLQRAMLHQSSELLGADLALSSPRPLDAGWLARADELGLRRVESLSFPSVLAHGDTLHMASIKALGEGYPLLGELRISDRADGPERIAGGIPAPGEVWLEPRLLTLLGVEVGDRVEFGEVELRVGARLEFEPGRATGFFSFAPRALIHLDDLSRAAVLAPGSRVRYRYEFAGEGRALARYRDWLEPQLEPSHRLTDVHGGGRSSVGAALERAERYLGLASLIAVVLAGVAIAMGARRYSERHFDVSAVMRCLGADQRRILQLYLPQLLILALIGGAVGALLGYLAQFGLVALLSGLLPAQLPPPGLTPALIGLATGLVVLAGFALPPILRLRRVPALRVLRRDLAPMPLRGWLVYGAALAAMGLLMWRYTGSAVLTLSVLGGGVLALLLFGLVALGLLTASRRLGRGRGLAWRYGLNNLWRRPALSLGQIVAFGLTFSAMALIVLVRGDLLQSWQNQLPADTPNHFAFNILPDQLASFEAFLVGGDIRHSRLYPMVRGRFSQVNGESLEGRIVPGENGANVLRRELNLTWSETLQEDNRIVAGRWWQEGDQGRPIVSLEAKLARQLDIELGDTLTLSFGGDKQLEVEVVSLRSLRWDSFRPNFYLIFPPGVLEEMPATYLTSFYLPPGDSATPVEMVRAFPAVTLVELERIMEQVRQILAQVTLAVEYVLLFVLLAGFAVLYAALQANIDERLHEGAILRTFGASRRQLRRVHLAEFTLLGLLAGLFAASTTELVAWLLYTRAFELDYTIKWPLWLALPLLGTLLIALAGLLGVRRVERSTPLSVLREL